MKSFGIWTCMLIISMFVIIAVAVAAQAEVKPVGMVKPMANYSSAAATTAFSTGYMRKKTVHITGNYAAATFGNFSGTVAMQCGPTSSGPWVTCKDAGNTAVSTTTPAVYNLDNLSSYVRFLFTKTKHAVTVWLFYSE
jgi:hypothetical protein